MSTQKTPANIEGQAETARDGGSDSRIWAVERRAGAGGEAGRMEGGFGAVEAGQAE